MNITAPSEKQRQRPCDIRVIKFRAYVKFMKKWLDWNDIRNFPLRLFDENGDSKDIVFVQFTGIYDVDGKEIYEGDIVSGGELVSFRDGQFRLGESSGYRDVFGMCQGRVAHRHIIGNIYDTPELIPENYMI